MRRWRSLILAGVFIGGVVGWMSAPGTGSTTPIFQATHTLIAEPGASDSSPLLTASALATLGAVPARVSARLGVDRQQVQSMVSTDTPVNTGLLLIIARSTDPAQAETLANFTAEELIAELGGQSAGVRSLEPAVASAIDTGEITGPTSRPARALLLGGFGLLLGVGAAVAVEYFDNRIRSKVAAEKVLGVPVLVRVPEIGPNEARLLTGYGPPAIVEAYRRLGTFVGGMATRTEAGAGAGARVIVVTSAEAGEGKTTTVAQLSAALGELGRSVLVVSADLRRPRLHYYFGRPGEPGLADVLGGKSDLRDLDLTTAVRGVRLLASGPPVENPALLLDGFGEILRAARGLGEVVLVDAPPLLGVSDAADIARHADGVLLIVRAGRTTTSAARRSAELLRRLEIPLLGAVLVGVDR